MKPPSAGSARTASSASRRSSAQIGSTVAILARWAARDLEAIASLLGPPSPPSAASMRPISKQVIGRACQVNARLQARRGPVSERRQHALGTADAQFLLQPHVVVPGEGPERGGQGPPIGALLAEPLADLDHGQPLPRQQTQQGRCL